MIHTSIVSSLESDWPTFSRKKVEREALLRNIAVRRWGWVLITVDKRRGFVNDPKVSIEFAYKIKPPDADGVILDFTFLRFTFSSSLVMEFLGPQQT